MAETPYLNVSLPCDFFYLTANFKDVFNDDESLIYGLGPNTLLLCEKTAKCLKLLVEGNGCKVIWVVLKFCVGLNLSNSDKKSFESKILVQVLIDDRVKDGIVVLSEDFIYNLEYNMGLRRPCHITSVIKPNQIQLFCERHFDNLPSKAAKVILSLIQIETTPEDDFVDKVLQSYFSIPRYLCQNDVFGVPIPSCDKSYSINFMNLDIIYFKVCEIEGNSSLVGEISDDVCVGYLVDSLVTIYQVSNNQDLHPANRLVFGFVGHSSLNKVLHDEKLLNTFNSRGHNLIPECFEDTFQVMCNWMEPFLCGYNKLQDIMLSPTFLISGPNGSGKTMMLEAVRKYFGINYWRVDCVMVGEAVPGQAEAKLKTVFSKLNTIAPCIVHFSNVEALFEDADGKDDVRILTCFEQQTKLLKQKQPVILMASTSNLKSMSSNISQLFLETININPPNQAERESILSWFIGCSCGVIDKQTLQAVAAQTSGFLLRDLEMLVSLAFKEKYERVKRENSADEELVFSDFTKIIGTMRKVFSESIGAPKVPSVSWKDVGGLEHLKKEILRSLRSNMFSTGLKRSGLLLHGPPGTGKTLLAKAVATQCGRNFLSVKGPELLNMYVGQSEHNVRDLFELGKAASPCIVFFDELDSLAPNRGRSGDSGGVMDRVVSQLLAEMDDLGSSGDVFILAATNRPDLIDPALLRPGRLDKLLYVGPCEDRASQLSVLTALTRKLKLAPDVDLELVVSSLPSKVSGAQLSALCSAAWLASARQSIQSGEHTRNPTVEVGQNHFLSALSTALN